MRTVMACLVLATGMLLACGQDSGSGGEAPAGGSGGVASPAPASPASPAATELTATAKSCLELVRSERYAEAIDPCTRAARELPDDAKVAEALQTAKQEGAAQARQAAAAEAAKRLGQ